MYGLGNAIVRALSFLLLPLYTRFLTPSDYGAISVVTATAAVLTFVFSAGMHGALSRFYFGAQTSEERRSVAAATWSGMTLIALTLALILQLAASPIAAILFRTIPVEYIRIAIWLAFLNVISSVAPILFQSEERPGPYVVLMITTAFVTAACIIYFVVLKPGGADGYLAGALLAAVVMAVPNVVITLRYAGVRFSATIVLAALGFGLPLVPHMLSSWFLDLSDRIILARHVSLRDLGIYALGYQFGTVLSIFSTALNNSWVPFIYREVEQRDQGRSDRVRRLVTYVVLANCIAAVAVALFAPPVIVLMTPPSYHRAAAVAPWIIAGYLFAALYFIPGNFLFAAKKTIAAPLATTAAALLNIGMNLVLVPRYGIWAACWATTVGYAAMFAFFLFAAQKYSPFPYEWARLGRAFAATSILLIAGAMIPPLPVAYAILVRMIALFSFPFLLFLFGFFTSAEQTRLTGVVTSVWAGTRAR